MRITEILYNSIRRLNVNYNDEYGKITPNKINIFIGENGSGKSTIIDIIRSLSDLSIIPSLPKENPLSSSSPFYKVTFDDGEFKYVSSSGSMNENNCLTKYMGCLIIDSGSTIFYGDISKFNTDENHKILRGIKFNLHNQIHYKTYSSNFITEPNENYIEELNKIGEKLNGTYNRTKNDDGTTKESIPVNSNNLIITDDNLIQVWLEEDKAMPNVLPLSWFPSGWRSYAEITSYLMYCNNGDVCLLEEPEINLHPRLQRLLLKRIEEISIEKDLQIFFSTHSSAMINASFSDNISIYHTQGRSVEILGNEKKLLEDLGYKASDLFQANCVIWVEGPSDRIYIKHWLSGQNNNFIEGVDYSFLFYGGRILSHFGLDDNSSEIISILKINTNSIVVMDSDRKKQNDKLNETKQRIIDECNRENTKFWITDGREIENYLDIETLKKSIASAHELFYKIEDIGKWSNLLKYKIKKDDKTRTANKVKVARAYVDNCHNKVIYTPELKEKIKSIIDFIERSGN